MLIRRIGISAGVLAFLFTLAPRAFAVAPTIAVDSSSMTEGVPGTIHITASGATSTTVTGTFPDGVSATNGTSTATISGTPAVGSADDSPYVLTITASNAATQPDASCSTPATSTTCAVQTFTLTVDEAPIVTSISPSASTMTVGQAGQINISTSGFDPDLPPTLSVTGTLPTGVKFTDNGNGSGKIVGTPAAGTAKSYALTLVATADPDSGDPDASAPFTLTVLNAATTAGTSGATCQTLNSNQAPANQFHRNDRFFVRGSMPGATRVTLLWNGGSPTVGSDGVNSNGTYLVSGVIPSQAALGANTVVARGTNAAGRVTGTATCGVNVVSGTTAIGGVRLPNTGVPTSVLIAIGVTMVELGGGLLLYTDRRRAQPVIGPWLQRTIRRLER